MSESKRIERIMRLAKALRHNNLDLILQESPENPSKRWTAILRSRPDRDVEKATDEKLEQALAAIEHKLEASVKSRRDSANNEASLYERALAGE